jgi:hypothetical protein
MSKRTSIVKALTEKFKQIDGAGIYQTNLFGNAYAKLKFWDEVNDFPSIYMVPGSEMREYLPSDFTWGFLNVSIKLYCRGENSQQELEQLLEDVEHAVDANRVLVYDQDKNLETTEILIQSITTDEGLLAPYAVGEINLQVRYQLV